MSDVETKQNIKSALQSFKTGNSAEKSLALFNLLGYNTKRQAPLDKNTYKGFKDTYLEGDNRFKEGNALTSEWKYRNFKWGHIPFSCQQPTPMAEWPRPALDHQPATLFTSQI